MKKIPLLTLILFLSVTLFAKPKTDAHLSGHVIDSRTGEHIPFVTINLVGTTISGASDATGHYFMKNLPVGTHTIKAQLIGYKPTETTVELSSGTNQEVNFTIEESALELDAVVVSANRNETNRREAAVVVGVISPKLFELTNSPNLAQGLKFQPGLRVENNCQNCGFQQVRINGLDGPYSQILIDSKPVFSALAGVYGLEQIPANMIERVEVMRGGGSALYGSNAIAGTINIITKEPSYNSFSAGDQFSLIGGSATENITTINASVVTDNNKAGMYVYGMLHDREAWDADGDGYSELGELKSETVGFRNFFKTSDYSKLNLEYHRIHEYRRGGDSLNLPPHRANVAEQTEHEINGGGANFLLFSRNYKHSLSLYASAQNVDRNSYYGAGQDPNAYGKTTDLTAVGGAQYVYKMDELWFMPATLTLGGEYSYDHLVDEMPGYNRLTDQSINLFGFYAQNEWKNERASILLGARLDKHSMIKNPIFSPRINLRYMPITDLNLRASYSAGYRAPQTFDEDLHVEAVNGNVALISNSPNLKPEYSHSISASVEYTFDLFEMPVNILAEGFYTILNDVFRLQNIGVDSSGNILKERQNASGAKVKGVNIEAKIIPSKWMQLQLGYTYQQSRYNKAESWSTDSTLATRTMLRSPDCYGYFTASFTPLRNLSTSLSGVYTGPMLVPHTAGYVAQDENVKTSSFFDLTAKVAYTFKINSTLNIQLNAGVQNIFNSFQSDFDQGPDRDAGYMYGPTLPRTYFVGLKFGIF